MSESVSPPRSPSTGFIKLPPIISNELDRKFLTSLSEYIERELSEVNHDDPGQRYVVHQAAFNKIIEYVTAYKPILTKIKKEYEETIEAIITGQREAVFLTGKLKAMSSEPSTLRNYRKRADQLEDRIGIVEKDNEKLQSQLDSIRKSQEEQQKIEQEVLEPQKKELKKDKRLLPGLTLEQSTNLSLLHHKLDKLDRQFKELSISFKTRYVPKSRKEELKDVLNDKVNQRDQLLTLSKHNRARQERLEIAVVAAQEYNRYKPPHQTVGDAVSLALARVAGEKAAALLEKAEQLTQGGESTGEGREGSPTNTSTFDEDDPSREKEAEMMLDYIEKFNELFEDGKYEEAAVHAANSPKGILRTPATLLKFKEARGRFGSRSPLLSFCDSLMSSVPAIGVKPNESLSTECVRCALEESRLDLLSHWIAQDRLTVSMEMANMIQNYCKCRTVCRCSCQALAQNIYTSLGEHMDVVICMLKQSRVQAALEYASKQACFTPMDYMRLLQACPSQQLAQTLVAPGRQLLPLGTVIRVLLDTSYEETKGLQLLMDLHTNSADGSSKSLVDAVMADNQTTKADWMVIVKLLQVNGYQETALQLLAAVTVQDVVQKSLTVIQNTD
ncbi:clathrin heavy chain linker domain-containing protein 1-like [Liolophura sinensis]|uniref:clathrin heavy chain linker domain-containing protein 1-like n=1 Tax=Liolophura sinensis TaxID=3198878 RepID=UPI00315845EF